MDSDLWKRGVKSSSSSSVKARNDNPFLRQRAEQICAEAQKLHFEGHTAKAIPIYARSIEICPTAEAHCYLGWAYSSHGRYDLGIQECLKAIALDPEFGNSYNDIGSYLVSQGKLDQSVSWFERAKKALRYESRHYPYMNLGRLYSARGWKIRAIREFQRALEYRPGEPSCVEALRELKRSLAS